MNPFISPRGPLMVKRRRLLRLAYVSLLTGCVKLTSATTETGNSVLDEAILKELASCDDQRRNMVAEAAIPFATLGQQYKTALSTLKSQWQAQGKLEFLIALEDEIKSVSPGIGIQKETNNNEILKLQKVYSSRLASLSSKYREAILKSENSYGIDLTSLMKSLTKTGRFEAAASISKLALESNNRANRIKDMISKRIDYLSLCNPDICSIDSAIENDGTQQIKFGGSLNREEKFDFDEVIWAPSSKEVRSIIAVNVPPGFNFVSLVGIGSFEAYIWTRILHYSVEGDGKVLATFNSDRKHWPRIIPLPPATKKIRLITTGNFNNGGDQSFWAWPRLHTGLSSVAAATGWPKQLLIDKI
jgi:hypothetical protein